MRYIACKSFFKSGIGGSFNILKGACIDRENNKLYYNCREICYISSQYAYDYFARNDDGNGYARFERTHNIIETIKNANIKFQKETEEYRSKHHNPIFYMYDAIRENYPAFVTDDSLFTFEFYDASIGDLDIIKLLVESVEQ